jgi:hypothetical protein
MAESSEETPMTDNAAKLIALAIVQRWTHGKMPRWIQWEIKPQTWHVRDEVGRITTVATGGYRLKARCDAEERLKIGDQVAVKVTEGHLISFVLSDVCSVFSMDGFCGLEVQGLEVSQSLQL